MAHQNHIHMGLTLTSAPENSPLYKWKVTQRQDIPSVVVSYRRTLRGNTRLHALKDDTDAVVSFTDYTFSVVIRDEYSATWEVRKAYLLSMLGQSIKFVDILDHPDDGTDHTTAVKDMALVEIGSFLERSNALNEFDVTIMLVDMSRSI